MTDLGAIFLLNGSGLGPKVRVTDRKLEMQTKSQDYNRADPQNLNRLPRKGTRMGLGVSREDPPLEPS